METIEDCREQTSISPRLEFAVQTGADSQTSISESSRRQKVKDAWQTALERTLLQWLCDPEILDDEGVDVPSGTIIRLAIDYAERFRDRFMEPPHRIVPDANGGIVFKRDEDDVTEAIHFYSDGNVEYQVYCDNQICLRHNS
jgi:hypothetical protein